MKNNLKDISGAGGSGGDTHTPHEDDDTLVSRAMVSLLDLVGEGEIGGLVNGAKSIYIDNTPLENLDGTRNFSGVTWNATNGTQAQSPLEGFDDVSSPVTAGVKVTKDISYSFTTSNPNADMVRVIMTIPALASVDTATGDTHGASVSYQIAVSTNGGPLEVYAAPTITGKTRSKYQRSHLITLPKPGSSWLIKVSRLTPDSTLAVLSNETWVDSYTEIVNSKLNYPNSALVSVRIDSAQFNRVPARSYLVNGLFIRVPQNYDPVTRIYSGIWNGTFKLAVSDNPAWIMYDLLLSKRYGLGAYVDATQVDKSRLYEIGKYCDELVDDGFGNKEARFRINTAIQTQAEAYKLLTDISSVFRGMSFWAGSQIGFVQDSPVDPTMIYSPANVIDGDFQYTGTARKDRHSVVLVTWNDPANGYKQQVEYVEDTELVGQFGVRKLELVAFGCTSRGQANRVGRWILYTEKYESNFATFTVGLDSALVVPGEVIRIQDPTRAGKRMAGRLTTATLVTATLDAPVELSAPGASISIRLADGTFEDRDVFEGAGSHQTLSWATPLPAVPDANTMFIVIEPNLKPMLARVLGISGIKDKVGEFQISAVEHNPTKYNFIDFGLAIETPKTSVIKTSVDAPSDWQIEETQYLVAPGVLGNKLHLSWFGTAPSYELRWRQVGAVTSNWTTIILTQTNYEIQGVLIGDCEFELTAFNLLYRSATLKYSYTAHGKTTPPTAPMTFSAIGEAMQVRLSWSYASLASDLESLELWSGTANDVTLASRIAVLPWPQDSYVDLGHDIGVTIYYFARIQDKSKNFSPWASASATTIKDPSLLLSQLNASLGVAQLTDGLGARINLIDGGVTQPALPRPLVEIAALQDGLNQQMRLDLNTASSNLLQSVVTTSANMQRIADAGVYVDPSTGTVKISGIEAANGHLSTVDGRLSAAEGSITLKASTTYVDSSIASAVLGTADLTLFNGMNARVTTAEANISSLTGSVALKAQDTNLTATTARVTSAETNISALTGAVATKVNSSDFTSVTGGLDARLGSAEVTLATVGDVSSITNMVKQGNVQVRQSSTDAETALMELLNGEARMTQTQTDLAYARQDLTAYTDAGISAEASSRLALAAVVGANGAALTDEKTTRATADSAEASARLVLRADMETTYGTTAAAATSASIASTKATDAGNSATSATTSANQAASSATTAATQAGIATTQSGAAATSATTASTQAGIAGTSATSASNSAVAASSSAGTAATKAGEALSSANASATSASSASTSANSAGYASTSASNSATNASTAAGSAATYAGQASSSAADAAGSAATYASNFSTVQARLDSGDYAAVKQESNASASALAGVMAEYLLKVDANGHVAAIKLSTGADGGALVVLADKFLFAQPSTSTVSPPLAPVPIVTIGKLGGVPAMGLNGNLIVDGSVTAQSINGTNLAVVNGTFSGALGAATGTLGALTIAANGNVKLGQTAYNTGTGFWLGDVGGTPKFSIGNPAGANMRWDGTDLFVNTATFDSFTASIPSGDLSASVTYGIDVTLGSRTVSVSGGKAPYSYLWSTSVTSSNRYSYRSLDIQSGIQTATATVSGCGSNSTTNGVLSCIVRDSNGRMTIASVNVTATFGFDYTYGGGGGAD